MPSPRRSLTISLPPLWLVGVCLFLPAVRSCEKLESPAQLLFDSKWPFVALLSPYWVAPLLLVVAVVALGRGRVDAFATRATAALVALTATSAAMLAAVGFDGHDLSAALWRLFAWVCLVAGLAVVAHARRLEPWARLCRFHASYVIFALPMAALLLRIVIGDGPSRVGVGALVFVAAYAALAVVHGRQLVSSSTA